MSTTTLRGRTPMALALTISAGRVLVISAPMVGARSTSQIVALVILMDGFSFQPSPEGHVGIRVVVGFGLGGNAHDLTAERLAAVFVPEVPLAQLFAQVVQDRLHQINLIPGGQTADVCKDFGFIHDITPGKTTVVAHLPQQDHTL